MVSHELLKSEKKELFKKISLFLSNRLLEIQTEGKITDLEIMKITGWTNTRISEMRHFDKYQIILPEKNLNILITGGLVTVADLKSNLDLNKKETAYINSLRIYEIIKENPELADAIIKAHEEGHNPTKIIQDALKS